MAMFNGLIGVSMTSELSMDTLLRIDFSIVELREIVNDVIRVSGLSPVTDNSDCREALVFVDNPTVPWKLLPFMGGTT